MKQAHSACPRVGLGQWYGRATEEDLQLPRRDAGIFVMHGVSACTAMPVAHGLVCGDPQSVPRPIQVDLRCTIAIVVNIGLIFDRDFSSSLGNSSFSVPSAAASGACLLSTSAREIMSNMSPRRANPQMPTALLEAAARLLAEAGPAALSARRLAAAVGTSTMAVYTYFGGMDDVVRAMVHEGFARLHRRLTLVGVTIDPVADTAALGCAYRDSALDAPHLYAVMFGGSSLGGFSLSDYDRQHGRYTLEILVDAVGRAMEVGRFSPADSRLVAHQMWIAVHGLVTLELGGYLADPYSAELCFDAQLTGLMLGAGDDIESARSSCARARKRHTASCPVTGRPSRTQIARPVQPLAQRLRDRKRQA
jgi:AcrR family transcriptional regulator